MAISLVTQFFSGTVRQLRSWISDDLADTLRSVGDAMFDLAAQEFETIASASDTRAATWNAVNHLQAAAATYRASSRKQSLGSGYDRVLDMEKELACYLFVFACFIDLGEYKKAKDQLDNIEDTVLYLGIDPATGVFSDKRRRWQPVTRLSFGVVLHPIRSAKAIWRLGSAAEDSDKDSRAALPIKLIEMFCDDDFAPGRATGYSMIISSNLREARALLERASTGR